jgi:hypothetical protein
MTLKLLAMQKDADKNAKENEGQNTNLHAQEMSQSRKDKGQNTVRDVDFKGEIR